MEEKVGALLVSLVATVAFGAVLFFWVIRPPTVNSDVLNVLVGALSAGYIQTLNYWFGSSAGSKQKDTTISNLAGGTKA